MSFMVVVLVLCIVFRLQSLVFELEPPLSSTPFPTVSKSKEPASKIAFLFLVRHKMPLDFLWEHFFQVQIITILSIYVWRRCLGFYFDVWSRKVCCG